MAEAATPGARLFPCLNISPTCCASKRGEWFSSLEKEHEAMTQNVIHLTRRPSTATTTTPHDLAINTAENMAAMAAHQEAENALAMALHYLRSSACNVPGATRKAVQALGALKRLHLSPAAGAGARAFASLEG
jgi:hypothetical protein